jgi:hypothetical protein
MIIFDLKCASQGHVFEAWFGSGGDYEAQRARGLVACPICGCGDVAKAPMAPAVPAKGNRAAAPADVPAAREALSPEKAKEMLATMAEMQNQLLAGSEHVDDRFADEARAIHLGEAEARSIHGRATQEEAESLREDGIPIGTLPFPVVPGRKN